MPRNGSGTYTLPAGNPVVTGTAIASTWANTTLDDLKTEVTDSLSRSAKGGMLSALALVDGTAALPALAFNNELSTGVYRPAANQLGFAVAGAGRLTLRTVSVAFGHSSPLAAGDTGTDVLFTTNVTRTAGNLLEIKNAGAEGWHFSSDNNLYVMKATSGVKAGVTNASLFLFGARNAGDAGAEVVVNSIVTRTAGQLLDIQNNASSRLVVNFQGSLFFQDAAGGDIVQAASNAGLKLRGNKNAADGGIDVIINSTATRTAGSLLDIQNNSASRVRFDFDGRILLVGVNPEIKATGTNEGLILFGNKDAGDGGADHVMTSTQTRTAGHLLLVQNNGTTQFFLSSASGGEAIGRNTDHTVRTTADVSTTSSTLTNITGLSFAVTASAVYEFDYTLICSRASSVTTLDVGASGPASPTELSMNIYGSSGGNVITGSITGFGSAQNAQTGTATSRMVLRGHGLLRNGVNAGTVQFQFRSSDNTTSVTITQGSVVRWRRLDALE